MDIHVENNECGQILLKIVATANSVIAELMRLSDHVPHEFRSETKLTQQKYGEIIFDFSYFKSPDLFEKKINDSEVLLDLDECIRESHGEYLARVYSCFESIHRYVTDLIAFLQDLDDGIYIQKTLENIFLDGDAKQLMCEALYLYGVMLLIAEVLFPGLVRERLIVAFYRHSGIRVSRGANIDEVCKLLRSTGHSPSQSNKKGTNYTENYFARIRVPENYVNLVVGYLRSDDVYHQVRSYPSPDHRSTALATQGSMLYVCLYFMPSMLQSHSSRMREIVDKFFSDNWIITYYMGRAVNLIDAWDSYKAAKQALNNTIEVSNVKFKAKHVSSQLSKLPKQIDKVLADGKLSESSVLNNCSKILNVLRQCNVVLRWVILHTSPNISNGEQNKKCISTRLLVTTEMDYNPDAVFELLLKTANLELCLSETFKALLTDKVLDAFFELLLRTANSELCPSETFKALLTDKDKKWQQYRESARKRVTEIADVFTGAQQLMKINKNDRLNKWFNDLADRIQGLCIEESLLSARKIVQMIQAVKQVKEFHELDSSAGIVQALDEVVRDLEVLVKVIGIDDSNLVTLVFVSDLSYAWILIDNFTTVMQDSIKKSPDRVAPLRAVFLKLSSGLELPLMRINQAKSDDLLSVSAYYSSQLVAYIRKVLQIIPETMFSLLEEIIKIQSSMREIPTRLEKEMLKEYAQMDQRYKMAELTQRVSLMAEGVSMMESTLVGVVEVDPKELLEEGVRREFVRQIARLLDHGFVFNPKSKESDLKKQLEIVGRQLRGFQTSFKYIQDYINIYGVKICQEEISRVISYCVEQECNRLLKKKSPEHRSAFQNPNIPIPALNCSNAQSVSFVGRLLREILRLTNPRTTLYIPYAETWYDAKTHKITFSCSVIEDIEESIGVDGLTGVDKLLGFLIVQEFQNLLQEMKVKVMNIPTVLQCFEEISSVTKLNFNPAQRQFSELIQKAQKICPSFLEFFLSIGQMQILRSQISSRLNSSCKLQAKLLCSALESLNTSLLADFRKHAVDPSNPFPDPDNVISASLTRYLDRSGFDSSMEKIYLTAKSADFVDVMVFVTLIIQMPKAHFSESLGVMVSNKGSDNVDYHSLVIGIASFLKQFNADNTASLVEMLEQYVRLSLLSYAATNVTTKSVDRSSEATNAAIFLQKIFEALKISGRSNRT